MKTNTILRWSSACLLASTLLSPAAAQSSAEAMRPGGVLPASIARPLDPAERLAMSLRRLGQNPYDVSALTEAGESALAVGDANAAISFLGRAEELSPASPRIKAALGGALVLLEKPVEALRLFAEAQALGYPDYQFAKDRGLAYDLRGDQRRAQQDYNLSLRHSPDDETIRRLALSLGVSGEKEQALRQLEPLLRKRDQGAWRARAFVLAMNGDIRGAERISEQVVPREMMGSFTGFLRRLVALNPGQRAAAVNFGTIPSDGRTAMPVSDNPFRPMTDGAATALASADAPPPTATVAAISPKEARSRSRRRPDRDQVALAAPKPGLSAVPAPVSVNPPPPAPTVAPKAQQPAWVDVRTTKRVGERIGPVEPSRIPPEARPESASTVRPVQTAMTSLPAPTPADAVAAAQERQRLHEATKAPVQPQSAQPLPTAVAAAVPTPSIAAPPPPAPPPAPTPPPPLFELPKAVVVEPPAQAAPNPQPVVQQPALQQPVSQQPILSPPPKVEALPPAANPEALAPETGNGVESAPSAPVRVATNAELSPPPSVAAGPTVAKPGFSTAESGSTVSAPPASVVPAPPAQVLASAPVSTGTTPAASAPTPEPKPVAEAIAPAPAAVAPEAPKAGLAAILSGLTLEQESAGGPVPGEAEFRKARLAAKRKAEVEAADEAKLKAEADAKAKEAEEKRKLAAANPARVWVQVATGSNRAGIPGTLRRIREQAPDAMKGLGGASVPTGGTFRILAGPVRSTADAKAIVGKLAKAGVSAMTFSSDPGEVVTRVP